MEIIEILPKWFLQAAVLGLALILAYALGKFFDYYKQASRDDHEHSRELSKENTKNISELLAITRVHEHRITKVEEDIENLQGERIVRYKRNGK